MLIQNNLNGFFFQDSLLDVIVSLGATDSKIIISGAAFGNSFTLQDSEKTLPGKSCATTFSTHKV